MLPTPLKYLSEGNYGETRNAAGRDLALSVKKSLRGFSVAKKSIALALGVMSGE
jgi:hypothetical protein